MRKYHLQAGKLQYELMDIIQGNEGFELRDEHVIYLDNHLLVVNKPAGLLVQSDKEGNPNLEDSARKWLKEKFQKPGNAFATSCHRLDRPVSGLVILARTSKALARMNALFQAREIKKLYICICNGKPEKQQYLRHWIKKNEVQNTVRTYTYPRGDARQADLFYLHAQTINACSLLLVRLFTGRHHQIRAQLGFSGLPIMGDAKYGKRSTADQAVCLCSFGMEFLHPVSGERLRLQGKMPSFGSWNGFSAPEPELMEEMFSEAIYPSSSG